MPHFKVYNKSCETRHCKCLYHEYFLRKLKKLTKKEVRNRADCDEFEMLALYICLAFFPNFDILASK